MNGYELSRIFWQFEFENPQNIKPHHAAIYFFTVEHCNMLGWKRNFGLPTSLVMEATGIKSYSSYKKYLDNLVDWGFIEMVEYSKNQYTSNIVALILKVKAHTKALDKAMIKHGSKHIPKQVQLIDSIDKQYNNEQYNNEQGNIPDLSEFLDYAKELCVETKKEWDNWEFTFTSKFQSWIENKWKDGNSKRIVNWKTKLRNTLPYLKPIYGAKKSGLKLGQ